MMKKVFKDPLFIFLALGFLLYSAIEFFNSAPDSETQIVISKDAVLQFMQYRSNAFDARAAEVLLGNMSEAERAKLIDEYIREEAYYREARAMGLSENDYIIRRRMVQKTEFLYETPSEDIQPNDTALKTYYMEHQDDYIEPDKLSLVHVFSTSYEKSAQIQKDLIAQNIAPTDAKSWGERFAFHFYYKNKSTGDFRAHFGRDFTAYIFSPTTPKKIWIGPIASDQGWHNIFITQSTPKQALSFKDAKPKLITDYKSMARVKLQKETSERVLENYEVIIEPDLKNFTQPKKAEQPHD